MNKKQIPEGYTSEYIAPGDPLPGFVRYRKLKKLIEIYGITSKQIEEIIGLKEQTIRVFRTRNLRQNITSEDLQKLYTFFGGVDEKGEPVLNVFKDF